MSPEIGEKDGAQEKNSQVVDFSGCVSDAFPAVDEVSYPIFEEFVNQKAVEESVIEDDPVSDDLPVGEVSHPTSEGLVNQSAAEDSVVKDDPISDYLAEDAVAEDLNASEDPSTVSYRTVGLSGPHDTPRVDEENPVAESGTPTADEEVCPISQGLGKQTAVDDGSVSKGLTQAVIKEADDPTVNDDPRLVPEGVVNLPAVEESIVEVDEVTNECINQTVDESHTLDIGSSTEQTADQGSHAVSEQLVDQTVVENIVCDLLDLEIDLTVAAEEFTGNDLQAVAEEENDGGAQAAAQTMTEIDNLLAAAEVFAEGELDGCAITEGEIAREDEKSRTGNERSTVVAAEVTQNPTAGKEKYTVTGEIAEKNTEIFDACERPQNYDGATSLRKLKAAIREKVLDRSNLIYLRL